MSNLKQRRIDLIQDIIHKDPARYGYLNATPFNTCISANFIVYPNDFLQALYDQMITMEEYHAETMKDDPQWGSKYIEFLTEYYNCYNIAAQYTQQQQQQYLANYYAQQQQQQQYAQQQYAQQQQYQQNQQQYGQQQQQYGQNQYYQKQHHQNQYYNQNQQGQHGQGQQQGYQQGQGYQQRNYHNRNQQNYNQQGQQGQQTDQSQQQQQRYQQNRQQGYQQRQNRYPNQQFSGQQTQNGYQQGGYRHGHHQQGNYQRQQHYQHQHPQSLDNLEETPVIVEEKVVVPPSPPPKPEPKPTKFSLTEIRSFISTWSDKDKDLVSKELIEKVNQVNLWTKSETSFDEKPEKPQQERKYDNKRRGERGDRGDRGDREQENKKQRDDQQQGFVTGSKYNKPSEAAPQLQLQRKDTGLKIVVGKNETLEARMIKKEIREKAGQDFATLMEKENESLGELAILKKDIIYNLNLLAPENLKDIQKDLTQYLFNDRTVCEVLIEQIIEKAWGQPKYASTYAKLCSEFSKVAGDKFHFQASKEKKSDKKQNPFKVFLISKVQHSFDKKLEEIPEFQSDQEKDNWLRQTKKKILGNVKFIAELIRSKVLKKRIMKICISQLIFTFLAKYYYFRQSGNIIDSYYDYYFEAMIEFIENVGQFYEKMDQSGEKKEERTAPYEPAEKIILDLIEMKQTPPEEEIEEITNLKADDYFKIFYIIDQKVLRSKNTRLSALLLNLTERRANKWQKHHSEADGPKKLKEIKEDIAKEEVEMNKVKQQKKESMEHLHDLVKAMYKDWDGGEKNEKAHFKNILKEYKQVEFLTESLNQIADDKKESVIKRIALFDVILETYFNLETLKAAWFECIKFMAFNSGDFPFSCSAIALILKKIFDKDASKLKEFFMKTQDEDEEFFIEDVYGRLYHYTKNEEIKELTEPNKKYSNQLEA